MIFSWIKFKRYPHQTALPTVGQDQRGQVRMLSGDGSDTTDALYFARNREGTSEWARLLATPLTGQFDTAGDAPTFTAQTGAGTTASTAGSVGNDLCGMIQLVPGGAGIAAGGQVLVTFDRARTSTNYIVLLVPNSSATRAKLDNGSTGRTTASWLLTADTALTAGLTYQWFYFVVGF